MNIALAICTHDRRALLEQTLAHIARLHVPSGITFSVVLVTNACTDESEEVAASWTGAFALHHEDEARPGLSYARNRAIEVAERLQAEFLIWCDDDVILEEDFLHGYLDAFRSSPDVAVFGGRVLPHFVPPSPEWLPRVIEVVGLYPFSCIDHGSERRHIEREMPFGANMAVRMSMVGDRRFDPRLGVTPTRKVGFEETTFLRGLLQGAPWLYVPASTLKHVLPPSRQSMRAIAQYFRAAGNYQGLMATQRGAKTATLFGAPRWAVRALISLSIRAAVKRVRHWDRFAALPEERELHVTLGVIEAYGRQDAPEVRNLIR